MASAASIGIINIPWPPAQMTEIQTVDSNTQIQEGVMSGLVQMSDDTSFSIFADSTGRILIRVRDEPSIRNFTTQPIRLEPGAIAPAIIYIIWSDTAITINVNMQTVLLNEEANGVIAYLKAPWDTTSLIPNHEWPSGAIAQSESSMSEVKDWIKCVVGRNDRTRAFGLVHNPPKRPTMYDKYDYCIIADYTGNFVVMENGIPVTQLYPYVENDIFSFIIIEKDGVSKINYYQNSSLIYRSNKELYTPLLFTAAIKHNDGAISGLMTLKNNGSSVIPITLSKYQWKKVDSEMKFLLID